MSGLSGVRATTGILAVLAAAAIASAIVAVPVLASPQSASPAEAPEKPQPRAAPRPMGAAVVAEQQSEAQEPEAPAAPEPAAPAPVSAAASMSPPRPRGRVNLPTKIDPKTGQRVVSITNLDLERIYGTSVVPVSSAAATPDTGAVGGFGAAAQASLDVPPDAGSGSAGVADSSRLAEIDDELKRLNRNELGIANPFLPPPKLTDAEKSAMQGKDNRERLEMTKQQIQELENEKARLETSPSGEQRSGR